MSIQSKAELKEWLAYEKGKYYKNEKKYLPFSL